MRRGKGEIDKRLVLAAGGTGGHMFPAEALADEMRKRGWQIALLTDRRGMRFVTKFRTDKLVVLPARNPNHRGGLLARIVAGVALIWAVMRAGGVLWRWRPSLVIGFGGYPSVPTTFAARIQRVPTGIHEQNAVLGRANRLIARWAEFVAHGFEVLHKVPKRRRGCLVHTGNPVREAIAGVRPAPYTPPLLEGGAIHLFIAGGSQGAYLFSKVVPAALAQLPASLRPRLKVVHQVREIDQSVAGHIYDRAGIDHVMAPFFEDIAEQLIRSHLVIGRAGASTLTELGILGRPSILVPLAIAMDDHQTENAKVFVAAEASIMFPESDFTPQALAGSLGRLFREPRRLARMAQNADRLMSDGVTQRLADLAEETILGAASPVVTSIDPAG